ncbi:MAG: hypothetical protein ABIQ81_05645 [Novosphingobium sp.]
MFVPPYFRKWTLMLAAIGVVGLAAPALAASEPSTRLVSCQSGSCLLVSGHREHRAAAVAINGHAVMVQGARKWSVRVPVETLREWAAPFERTITVSVANTTAEADLPIGLLGHVENLAMLFVTAQ